MRQKPSECGSQTAAFNDVEERKQGRIGADTAVTGGGRGLRFRAVAPCG